MLIGPSKHRQMLFRFAVLLTSRTKCFDGICQARLTSVALAAATNCSSSDMVALLSAANADTLHTHTHTHTNHTM